jgi:WD40 repeat protein
MDVHDKDVNYVDFYLGSDNPCLLMTSDDHMIKVWDDLSKSCVQKMQGYTNYRTQVSLYSTRPTSSAAAKTAP